MSKNVKTLSILTCAVIPVLLGASALAQDVVTPIQYADGSPPDLPTVWPSSAQSPTLGASATGTNPIIASDFVSGSEVADSNGSPNNGATPANSDAPLQSGGSAGVSQTEIGSGQAFLLGETFTTTSAFKLGGISVEMNNGAGSETNDASLHLFQLNSSVTGSSTQYNLSTQAASGDLLGSGAGAFFTIPAADNIEQFVFSGTDQVQLLANTTYAFEFWVDQNSGDDLGLNRTNGNDTNPQPYSGGATFGILFNGSDPVNYGQSDTSSVTRTQISGGQRQMLFALYAAPPSITAGTWTGTAGDSNWNTAGNWVSDAVPGTVPGDSALFGSANNTNTLQTVNLNGNQTVGTITFNNAGSLYTIAQGSSGTLNLQNSSGSATIDDLIGHSQSPTGPIGHTISAPMTIASGGLSIAVGQAADTLVLSGNIGGTGGMTLKGDTNALMAGTVVLSGDNTYSGGTTVSSGTLLIEPTSTPSATLSALPKGPLTITGGTVKLAANVTAGSQSGNTPVTAPTSNVNITSLAVSGNGTLDIGNNHIIINYGSGTDPISSIAALIVSGYNASGTHWAGTGITSSAAAANSGSYGIGYADANDTGDPAGLASGQIEIAYTLLGDANLDGKVNGSDFTLMATNFNDSVTNGWDKGDFNYSGTVNGDDFVLLANNFNDFASQSSVASADLAALSSFAASNGISLTSVPEPASAGVLALSAIGMLRRRRRSSSQDD
jgi:autotransporter-associated beta strand protein